MSSLASTAAQGVAFWMDQNEAEQLESRVPAMRRCEGWSTNLFRLTAYEHLWTRSTIDKRCGFSCQFHQNASIFSLSVSWRSKQLLQSSIATVFCFIFSAYQACANYQSQDRRSRKTIRTLPTQIARVVGALAVHNLTRLYPESHPSRPPAVHAQKQVAGPRFQLGETTETTMTKCGNWTDRAWDCLMHAVLRVSFYTLPVQENIRSILESMARKTIRWIRARTLSPLSVCRLSSHLSFHFSFVFLRSSWVASQAFDGRCSSANFVKCPASRPSLPASEAAAITDGWKYMKFMPLCHLFLWNKQKWPNLHITVHVLIRMHLQWDMTSWYM